MSKSPLKKYFEKSALKSHKPGHSPSWLNNPDNFEDNKRSDEEDDHTYDTMQLLDEAKEHPMYNVRPAKPTSSRQMFEATKDYTDEPGYDEDAYREDD